MTNVLQTVKLETLAGGAVRELFQAELERVLENIADINTDPQVARTITLSVTLKPGPKRESADVKVKCASKLAGIVTVNTQLFMGRHQGKLVAVENDPRQGGLFDAPDQPQKLAAVAPINRNAPAKEG